MSDRQSQRAGDNSHLVQISGDYVSGVTLDQALEVADLTARKVAAEEFAKAEALAMQRIEQLNSRVVRELDELKRLAAFADPAFQASLRKAQIGAACSDQQSDYDMLARLLTDRADRGAERKVRAGLDLAIGIVDQVDASALAGLTVLQAAMQFRPVSGSLDLALGTLDRLYAQLPLDELPKPDGDWLDHLDVLGAIRLVTVGSLRRFDDFFPLQVPGLVAVGVLADSEEERLGREKLTTAKIDLGAVEHELKPGYRRVPYCDVALLERDVADRSKVTAQQAAVALDVARETYKMELQDGALVAPLMEHVRSLPSFGRVPDWWNPIPHAVDVTAVGRVLARANAKRCDALRMLPDLD